MKKDKLKLLIIPALIAVTGISATSVYSWSNESITVKYGEEVWDTQTEFSNKWYSNIKISGQRLTFEIDLSDYIKDEVEVIDINQIVDKTALLEKVDGTQQNLNIEISEIEGQVGKYNVLVDLVEGQDREEVIIRVNVKESNQLNIPQKNIEFKVVRDVTNPEVLIEGVEDGKVYDKSVDFKVDVQDFTSVNAFSEVKQSGELIDKEIKLIDNKGRISFNEDGNYEVKIVVDDIAGNKTEQRSNFKINTKGPTIDSTIDSKYIGESNKDINFLIDDINGIDIENSTVIIRNGEKEESKKFDTNGTLAIDLSAYGNGDINIVINAVDSLGKTSTKEFTVIYDDIDPTFNVSSNNEVYVDGEIYDAAFDLNFICDDINFKDFKIISSTIDDIDTELILEGTDAKNKKIAIKEDGIYNITIESTDLAGNVVQKELEFGLDTLAPVITANEKLENQFFTTNKEITFNVKEQQLKDEIQIVAKKYKNDSDEGSEEYKFTEKFIKDKGNYSLKHNFTESGRYEVTITAKDKTEKVTTETFKFKIDTEAPKVEFITDIENEGYYTETKVVEFKVEDNYGIDGTISSNGDKIEHYECSTHEEHQRTKNNGHIYAENGKYTHSIKAKDLAGNKTDEKLIFTIDKCAPEIIIKVNEDESSKKEDKLYINTKSVTTDIKESNLHESEYILKDSNGNVVEVKPEKIDDHTQRFIAQELKDESYILEVSASDKILVDGVNRESSKSLSFAVDTTIPEVEIEGVEDKKFYNTDKTLNIKAKDLNWDKGTIKISKDDKEVISEELNNNTVSTFKFDEDGDYSVSVDVVDLAGNDIKKNISFVIDKSNPLIAIENFENSELQYLNELEGLKGQINEDNFNVESFNITAKKVRMDGTQEETKLDCDTIDTSIFDVVKFEIAKKHFAEDGFFNENAKYSVSIEESDLAGNKSNSTINFIIDSIEPKVEIKGLDLDTDNKHYNTDINIDININDLYHDTNKVEVLKDGKVYDVGNLTGDGVDKNLKAALKEEGSYVVNINSVDKAKNEVNKTVKFVIDKTPTKIQILNKDALDGKYFNSDKEVSVLVEERYFNHKDFALKVEHEKTSDNGESSKVELPFNMNKDKVTGSFKFADDGKHTLTLSAKDATGNSTKGEKVSFVIDKVAPKININGVEDGKHYNEAKSLSIEIFDTNHNINSVNVTKNGAPYNAGNVTINGNLATLNHSFTAEGKYSVVVSSEDKAGNKATSNISFAIDKTAPVITPQISDSGEVIKDGSFINKVFKPVFGLENSDDKIDSITINEESYSVGTVPILSEEVKYECTATASDKAGNKSDISFSFTLDTTAPKVDITGVTSGFFNEDLTPKYVLEDKNLDEKKSLAHLNGKSFVSGTKIEKDDYYNLKIKGQDMANNMNEKSVSFVLDTGKPKIIFEDAISGEYFTEDFIPKFVIEDLTDYQVVSMLLNGENYDMGDMVTNEGKNVLFIEVKDKAGNLENLTLEFMLDKTAPKFIVNGVEDGKEYNGPVEATIKLENPSDKLKSVLVNGKPANGDIKEIDGEEVMKLNFKELDDYKIELVAEDLAGNETKETIKFEIVSETLLVKNTKSTMPFVLAIGGILASGLGIFMAKKKKQN